MRTVRKILFLSVIVTLISFSIPLPYNIGAAEQQINYVSEQKATINFNDEEIDDVYLFETDSIDSNILMSLESEALVTIVEQGDQFTLIEVINRVEDNTTLVGYVLNEYVKSINEEVESDTNDEQMIDDEREQTEEDESTTVEENDATKETDEVTERKAVKTEQISLTSLNDEALYGVALKNKTNVYMELSRNSTILRSYVQGASLKFYEFNENWYRATVKYNGQWTTGYIHKDDVGDKSDLQQTSLEGIAIKNPTNVYETNSTKANVLRSYELGTILKYRTFNADWYEATVKYNGKWTKGYIYKSDVENTIEQQVTLNGIALRAETNIYEKASAHAKVLRSYADGTVLKYRTLSENWYEATVKYNGKWRTGYLHKSDVDEINRDTTILNGIALKNPTKIYTRASTRAGAHKTYHQGTILKFTTLSDQWYEAVVFVNGKRRVGYIHKQDIERTVEKQVSADAWVLKTPTNVYERASRNSKVIRNDYKKEQTLKVKSLSKNWFEVTVRYNNKWVTGYVHAKDISLINAKYTDYNLTLKDALNIQLQGAPQTDKKYAWVSKDYIENNKVTADELNVRLGPGTNYKSVDKIAKDTEVTILDEYNGWYTIEFNHSSQWTHASPKDVMTYLNPENYVNDDRQKFQFLDLSKPSGASVSVLNRFLNGKGILSGQGKAFIDASIKLGVNDIYLLSHAILETGHGTSNLAKGLKVGLDNNNEPQLVTSKNEENLTNIKTVYNMFGIRAFDSCPESCGATYAYSQGWDTPYKAIVGGAEFISSDYIQGKNNEGTILNTLYKMRWNPEFAANNNRYGKQYATDIGWAVKQVNTMYNLYSEIGDYKLVLDIPVYLK